jgi:hypothetical protein
MQYSYLKQCVLNYLIIADSKIQLVNANLSLLIYKFTFAIIDLPK